MDILKQLAEEECKTIILSTHDVEQSLSVADKLLLFIDDKVKLASTTEAIESEDVARLFESRGIVFDKEKGVFVPKQKR